jgi:hypothetical protein
MSLTASSASSFACFARRICRAPYAGWCRCRSFGFARHGPRKRYGLRLLPELYAHLNPMPYEAATQMEKDLAEDLRRAGYTVAGGH